MNKRPAATDPARQQRGIFILRRHDHTESLKGSKVLGQRKRDSRTSSRKGCVGNGILLEFRDVSDARIFDAPNLFRILLRIRQSKSVWDRCANCRCHWRNARRTDAIIRSCLQRGTGAGYLHPANLNRAGVHDTIDRIGPVFAAEKWIAGMANKQRMLSARARVFVLSERRAPSLRL